MTGIYRALALSLGLGALLAACQGSEIVRPIDPVDTSADTSGEDSSGDVQGDTTPVESTLRWWFVTADGAAKCLDEATCTLGAEDELTGEVGSPGFQVEVQVEMVEVAAGTDVDLVIDGNVVGQGVATAGGGGTTGVRFTSVTIPADGRVFVTVRSTDKVGAELSDTKEVTTAFAPCDAALVVATVADGACVAVETREGALGVAVTVAHASGQCDRAALSYTWDGATVELPEVELDAAGEAVFFVPFEGVTEVEGELVVAAKVLHPEAEDLAGSAEATWVADNTAPAVVVTAPAADASLFPVDDLDLATDGLQTTVAGTVDDLDAALTLTVDGVEAGELVGPAESGFTFESVTLTEDRSSTFAVRAIDACDNSSETSVTVPVRVSPAVVVITAPLDAATLLAAADGDATTALAYELSVSVSADSAVAGDVVIVECAANGAAPAWTEVGRVTADGTDLVPAGVFTVPSVIDVATLGSDVLCRARLDSATNPGVSATVGLTVALPAPTLGALTSPVAGACLTGSAWTLTGTATALDGRNVDVRVTAALGGTPLVTTVGPVAAGAYSGDVSVGTLADGAYTVTVDGTDAFGNVVSATQASPSVAVERDTTAPAVSVVSPQGSLTPATNPAHVDQDLAVDGYQTTVTLRLTDAHAVGAELCLALAGASAGCKTVAADGTAAWTGITLQPGQNTIVASGTDACGLNSAQVSAVVTLVSEAPAVVIELPAQDTVVTATTATLVARATTGGGANPVLGAEAALFVGGAPVVATATPEPDGRYRFTNVPLAAGANVFTVQVTANGVPGTSGPRTITRKTALPTIALTAPAAGVLNLASPVCAAGGADCIATASAVTTDAEDGSVATLAVDCGAPGAPVSATVTAGAATFPTVTLPHGATCTLTPGVTDVVAQSATGTPVIVTVDRVAPTVALTSPTGATLLAADDADASAAGLQHLLTATLGGVEVGQVVTATLVHTSAGGAQTTTSLTHTVATATADGGAYAATFESAPGTGTVSFDDGTYAITITVSDAAGNPAAAATASVFVYLPETSIRITFPDDIGDVVCSAATPCAAGRLCNPTDSRCYDAWSIAESHDIFTATTGLLTTAQNLRVCSNHPSLSASPGAIPCATAPDDGSAFYELVRADTAGGLSVTSIEATAPDGFQTVVAEVLPLDGGVWLSSNTAATTANQRKRRLYIDLERPVIASLTSPSDTVAPFGVLNAAEQVAPTRQYSLAFESSEAGTAKLYVNGALASSTAVTAGLSTVTAQLATGVNTIYVIVTDAVGNASLAPPAPGAVVYTPTVDIVGPSLAFTTPAESPLMASDDLDVRVASDAEGRTVTLADGGVEVATALVTSGVALFPHATVGVLSDGSHTLTASVTDASGNVATAATSPPTIVVDTLPPSGVIRAPLNGASLADADDADPAAGFQLAVRFGTADGATTWSLWTEAGCDAAFTACSPASLEATGPVTQAGADEPDRLITFELGADVSRQRLVLETVDAVGNTATTSINLTFTSTACRVVFSDVPSTDWYNASFCASGTSCATANVTVTAAILGHCDGLTEVRLLNGATTLGTVTPAGATASFLVTLADNASLALEAKALAGATELATTGARAVQVDLTPPTVAFVAGLVDGFDAPGAGQTVTLNADDDRAPLTPGLQLNARVRVSDSHLDGGALVSLAAVGATSGTVALTPTNGSLPLDTASPSPFTHDLLGLTLADLDTHTVTVTAEDAAGNSGTSSFVAAVDVTRPAPVAITSVQVITKRRVRSQVRFTAVGDNGTTGGPVASYDMRYSRSPITEDNFDAACNFKDLYVINVVPAPAAPGTTLTGQLGAPDKRPFTDPCKLDITFEDGVSPASDPAWYYAVRATDAAGNRSTLGSSSVAVQTRADIQLEIGRVKFSNDAGSAFAGIANFLTLRGRIVGDIDADGRPDLVTGSEQVQRFCVLYGHAYAKEEVLTTASGTNHDCLLDTSTLFPGEVVRSLASSVRRLRDVNGDGIEDFGITGRFGTTANAFTGEAFLLVYLGRASRPVLTSPDVVVRGIQHLTDATPYVGACGLGDFDGKADGGGTADDFGVGEPAYNRMHVIPGRRSWTPGQARVTINLGFDTDRVPTNGEPDDSAVRVANGIFSVYGPTFATNTALFGLQCGGAGDVLPTPSGGGTGVKADLIVHQSGSSDARLFVIPGREAAAGTIVNVSQNIGETGFPTAEDSLSLRLRQESTGIQSGFGSTFLAGVDVTGDAVPDVVAGVRRRSSDVAGGDGKSVYVFDGAKFAANVAKDVRVTIGTNPKVDLSWTGANGYVLDASVNGELGSIGTAGNFDAWFSGSPPVPSNDLLIGNAAADAVEFRAAHKFGVVINYGQFPVVDAEFDNIYSTGGIFPIGLWIEGGFDLTGDTLLDIATGSAQGEILIVR